MISQKYSFEFKKMLKEKISSYIYNLSNDFIDNLFSISDFKYITLFTNLEENIRDIIKNIILDVITFFDEKFRNSKERKELYYINVKSDHRAFQSSIGYLDFHRTYYESKDRKKHFYFIDELLGIDAYARYDSLTKAATIDYTMKTNQKLAGELVGEKLTLFKEEYSYSIPRQTIYRWIREWQVPMIKYEPISIEGNTLYIMGDEKWIHEQIKDNNEEKKKHFIMSKCFIAFSGIEQHKNRRTLKDKFVFITSSKSPWNSFLDVITQVYDFNKLKKIVFLSDAGSWLVAGAPDLKMYPHNQVIQCLCEFHVRQKVNRITSNEEYRCSLNQFIDEDKKKDFKVLMNTIKEEKKDNEKRLKKLEEYENYIIKNWNKIKNMANSECKSSMESHISHCVAAYFSSRPKAYAKTNIEKLLKLQEAKLNGLNIKLIYLKSYKNDNQETYNQKELDFSIFDSSSSNIPIIEHGQSNLLFLALNGLAHP